MVAIVGTYLNGVIKLNENYNSTNPVKVIVTFLEDENSTIDNQLNLSDFSFSKSQKNLENFKGSLSDTIINERQIEK